MIQGRNSTIKTLFLILCIWAVPILSFSEGSEEKNITPPTEKTDVVLLLDASGSMLSTDPLRLRDQGAKLFTQFLRGDNQLGLIEFSEDTKVLRKLSVYNSDQEAEVSNQISSIASTGNYTDLLGAIKSASTMMKDSGRADANHLIILLSDGKMEPNPAKISSTDATKELLDDLLPRLKENNIKIHTLYFSDLADKDLLSQIAVGTDGVNWFTDSVDKVHESFADLFLVVKKPQVVPLTKKGFLIDGEVTEATFYINRSGAPETEVISPDGKKITATNHDQSVKWFRTDRFDVVTILNPDTGNWQVNGLTSDDGFATILTNLKLITDWPSVTRAAETNLIEVRLFEGDKPISLPEMSGVISYAFQVTPTDKVSEPIIREFLFDDGTHGDKVKSDGVFTNSINLTEVGEYRLRVVARGPTFEREQNIPFRVRPKLVSLKIEKEGAATSHHAEVVEDEHATGHDEHTEEKSEEASHAEESVGAVNFVVTVSSELSSYRAVDVKVVAIDKANTRIILPLNKDKHNPLEFFSSSELLPHEGKYTIVAELTAKSKKGDDLNVVSDPVEYTHGVTEIEGVQEIKIDYPKEKPKQKETPLLPIGIVTIVNILFTGVGYLLLAKAATKVGEEVEVYTVPQNVTDFLNNMKKMTSDVEVNYDDPRFAGNPAFEINVPKEEEAAASEEEESSEEVESTEEKKEEG